MLWRDDGRKMMDVGVERRQGHGEGGTYPVRGELERWRGDNVDLWCPLRSPC